MSVLAETHTLSNGNPIPKIGFGTWLLKEGDECYNAVADALRIGYRHLDTARAYHNEASVGRAVRDSDIAREEIYVTSKLPAEAKAYDKALEEFETTMREIGLDYLDLYLVHAPWPWNEIGKDCREENRQIWKAMEEFLASGRVKAIGVSNFGRADLDSLFPACESKPMVNQTGGSLDSTRPTPFKSVPSTTSSSRLTRPSRTASSSTIPKSATSRPATASAHHNCASAICCKRTRSCCPRRPRPRISSR